MLVTLTVLGGVPLFYNVAMPPGNRGLSCSSWCSEGESSLNRGQYDTYKEHIQNQVQHTHVYSLWNIFTFKSMITIKSAVVILSTVTVSEQHIVIGLISFCTMQLFLLVHYFYWFFTCSMYDFIWWPYFWCFFFFYSLVKKLSLPRVVVREIPQGNGRRAPHLLRCRHQQFT